MWNSVQCMEVHFKRDMNTNLCFKKDRWHHCRPIYSLPSDWAVTPHAFHVPGCKQAAHAQGCHKIAIKLCCTVSWDVILCNLFVFLKINLCLKVLVIFRCIIRVNLEMELVCETLVYFNHVNLRVFYWILQCTLIYSFYSHYLSSYLGNYLILLRNSTCVVMKLKFFYQPNKYYMLINCPVLCNEWMNNQKKCV